jgi:hypothetical protein
MTDFNLNPDGPHSRDRTATAGQLFDDISRFLVYASMPGKGGLESPGDVYRLLADLYSATGRISQICSQVEDFLSAQAATGRLYEARSRDVAFQVGCAAEHLGDALEAAERLTRALQAVQADISGLGVKESTDD